MDHDLSTVVRTFWEDVWTQGQVDRLSDICDPSWRENGEPADIDRFKRAIESWRRVFPDFAATVEDLVVLDAERVVSRVTYTGTQRLPWAGLPATDLPFTVIGIDIFTVRDGRIVELWHSVDHYVMAMQLGGRLVPGELKVEG